MTKLTQTLPANSDKPCDCCGRIHRKLTLVDGYWLGSSCGQEYAMFKNNNNVNSLTWRGYEKKHAQLVTMTKKG